MYIVHRKTTLVVFLTFVFFVVYELCTIRLINKYYLEKTTFIRACHARSKSIKVTRLKHNEILKFLLRIK
jgi:hypothetical protein